MSPPTLCVFVASKLAITATDLRSNLATPEKSKASGGGIPINFSRWCLPVYFCPRAMSTTFKILTNLEQAACAVDVAAPRHVVSSLAYRRHHGRRLGSHSA